MSRCARRGCGRWRPDVLARVAGLGLYFDDAWYCSANCLDAAARERLGRPSPAAAPTVGTRSLRLGVLLAHQVGLSSEVLNEALEQQRCTGLRLGAQLVRMGAASSYEVLRALAAQAGVGFLTTVDRGRLLGAPGNLSPNAVRALGLVPLGIDDRNEVARVACVAPLPRTALAAMRQLTGYRIEPYLVSDEQFPLLLEAYGASRVQPGPAHARVGDVRAAAARIVEAARANGGVRMAEARCDDHVWVRLEGGGQTEDLWLRAGSAS